MSRAVTDLPHDYPTWVPPLVAIPPLFFGAMSVSDAGDGWPVIVTAVLVAIAPWLVNAAGVDLHPRVFAAWVIAPLAVLNLAGDTLGVDLSGESHSQFTLMILVWLLGEMAAVARARDVGVVTGVVLAVVAGRGVVEPAFGHAWVFWAGGGGIALLTGFMLRRQQQTLSELQAAQAALAEDAVQRERQRIAREVHDVVAHTLTVTLMHLQAARRALEHDPDAAREALRDAETLGRRSLADIRRTVGLLRERGDAPEHRALPEAGDVPALLDSYRAAGIRLRTTIDADLNNLDPASGLALYRLVQESLSNAATHAPGAPIELAIRSHGDQVVVEVANPTMPDGVRTRGSGLGLVGMDERVRLLGGSLRAGRDGSVWKVGASLPAQPAESGLAGSTTT